MYTATAAVGIRLGINKRWETIDISAISVALLYYTYRKIYLTLTTGTPITTAYLDMDSIKNTYAQYAGTVAQLMVLNGDNSFPTTNGLPAINTKYARYKDAFRANYKATPVDRLYGINAAPENRDCILLTRNNPTTNYTDFYNHCLVTVNGFLHQTDTNGVDGILVYDAVKSLRICNQNQMGILSFKNMCSITTVPILSTMISKNDDSEPYSSSAYIDLNTDITNKTVFLSIGGYLHTSSDSIFSIVGNNTIKVDFNNYPILDRYYEMKQYFDVSSIVLSNTPSNISQISVAELLSDANIVKLLTLSQSFVIVLDAPTVFTNKQYIKKTGLPGMYISYSNPTNPIIVGLGRMPEYWVTPEDGQFSLTVFDGTYRNKVYNTTNPLQLNSVADSDTPTDPEILAGVYMLEIGKDI